MDEPEPLVTVAYRSWTLADGQTFAVEVRNSGSNPIASVKVAVVYDFENRIDETEKARRLFPDLNFASATRHSHREYLFDRKEESPLPIGETRRFIFPPLALPNLLSAIESLSQESFFLTIELNGKPEPILDGATLYEFVHGLPE